MSSEMPFQDPHNWVGTTPKMQKPTTSLSVVAHNDSSWFIHCPSVELFDCTINFSGRQDKRLWFATDWQFLHLRRAAVPVRPHLGSSMTVDVFYPSSLLSCHSGPPWALQDYSIAGCRVDCSEFTPVCRESIFTAPAGTVEKASKAAREEGGVQR